MHFKAILAIIAGKLILNIIKLLNSGGGTAAPGYYALKFYPEFVTSLKNHLPKSVIITGTNGKTTTARLLSQMATAQNLKIIRNHTGSNLERGIASTILTHYSFKDLITQNLSKKYDLAIWELDEAAFSKLSTHLNPSVIVFLNIFRDQLDRYGEVNSVLNKWCEVLAKINKETIIITNHDDYSLNKLESCFEGVHYNFSIKDKKILGEKNLKNQKAKSDMEAFNIKAKNLDGAEFEVNFKNQKYLVNLPIPGIYHIYDFLAALLTCFHLELDIPLSIEAIAQFSPAFGRLEKVVFKGLEGSKMGLICLIKNPMGTTQILETIKDHLEANDHLFLSLNDNLADGTDVSWIWDAQFEILNKFKLNKIIISGSRADDLALRLKYAEVKSDNILIEPNIERALKMAREDLQGKLFILPTYTALLELQKILTKQNIKPDYWKN